MKTLYSNPSMCLMRPPIDSPKTRMNSALESTGAAIVCVQSLVTRATSRPDSEIRPRWRSAKLDTLVTVGAVLALAAVLAAPAGAFQLIGHRGARGLAPENTLPGFMLAMRLGVSAVETDAVVTRDHQVVLAHDLRVNGDVCRGPYVGRFFKNLTAAQVHRLDCGRRRAHD